MDATEPGQEGDGALCGVGVFGREALAQFLDSRRWERRGLVGGEGGQGGDEGSWCPPCRELPCVVDALPLGFGLQPEFEGQRGHELRDAETPSVSGEQQPQTQGIPDPEIPFERVVCPGDPVGVMQPRRRQEFAVARVQHQDGSRHAPTLPDRVSLGREPTEVRKDVAVVDPSDHRFIASRDPHAARPRPDLRQPPLRRRRHIVTPWSLWHSRKRTAPVNQRT
ncbi:hypothetical protein [Embleya hyalina]|uniref:hypothetical protein n=1 Tax=Embleya hyalina TaxID=516124 RepID=UPI000F8342CD|nr:hypothetical protein [Embleya hyalina]